MRFSDTEWATIVVAAALEGWEPNPWVQQVALEQALQRQRGDLGGTAALRELTDQIRDMRRLLRNIGGNINDLARVANSTGELPAAAQLQTVLRVLGDRVHRVDTVLVSLLDKPLRPLS